LCQLHDMGFFPEALPADSLILSSASVIRRPARQNVEPDMSARTLLIVDDDADLRMALMEQLALYEEFQVLQEETAEAGMRTAKNGLADLLIMDVGLPDMDGREAVRQLRKAGFKPPIIMLTGHDTDSDTVLG